MRVRIGLHTGTAALAEDGDVGVDVHRADRIATTGHGGQIVSSGGGRARARSRTRAAGPRPLGAARPPREPERIFQLEEPGLGGDFPPLRARPGATPVRVVLADDSVLLREGVARLLDDAGFDVVGAGRERRGPAPARRGCTSPTSRSSTSGCRRRTPTRACARRSEIRERAPGRRACSCSRSTSSRAYALELLADTAEGVGYLLKDRVADVDEFAAAVRRVAEGGSALDPAIVTAAGRPPSRATTRWTTLTPREREVLELMAEGRSNQAIAERLFVTARAVEKHVTSIFGSSASPPRADDHRRVLAVLALLRGLSLQIRERPGSPRG